MSEIAEKAAREIIEQMPLIRDLLDSERTEIAEIVERAIAESQAPEPEKLISLFSDLGSTWAVLRNCKDFMDAEKGVLGGFWKQFDKLMGEAFRMQIALIKSRQESPKGNENV